MRKVTSQVVAAFLDGRSKKVGNSETRHGELFLHGNLIARQTSGGIEITNAGWSTNTTKERLNGIPGVNIHQKNYQWYLNGLPWNGDWRLITQ